MSAGRACDAAPVAQLLAGEALTLSHAPLTDGGEGFCPILTRAASGYMKHHKVSGPLGEEVDSPLGWVNLKRIPESALNSSV